MNQSSSTAQPYIFVDVLSLLIGVSLFVLGSLGLFQVVWAASFLIWFSILSLLLRYAVRWSGHRFVGWFQRFFALLSLAGLIGIVWLSTWPDRSGLSVSLQGATLGVWGLLLFLCARFVRNGAYRSRMYFFLWFPILTAVRLFFPSSTAAVYAIIC